MVIGIRGLYQTASRERAKRSVPCGTVEHTGVRLDVRTVVHLDRGRVDACDVHVEWGSSDMKWFWSSRVGRFAMVAFGMLALAEGLLRLVPSPLGSVREVIDLTDDARGFELKANTEVVFPGLFENLPSPVVWKTNPERIRSSRPGHDPGSVAIIGDSEAFGWAVEEGETIAMRMEAREPGLRVLNLGVPGYNIDNVAVSLDFYASFQPRTLIYVVNDNDFEDPAVLNVWLSALFRSELIRRVQFVYYRFIDQPRQL